MESSGHLDHMPGHSSSVISALTQEYSVARRERKLSWKIRSYIFHTTFNVIFLWNMLQLLIVNALKCPLDNMLTMHNFRMFTKASMLNKANIFYSEAFERLSAKFVMVHIIPNIRSPVKSET